MTDPTTQADPAPFTAADFAARLQRAARSAEAAGLTGPAAHPGTRPALPHRLRARRHHRTHHHAGRPCRRRTHHDRPEARAARRGGDTRRLRLPARGLGRRQRSLRGDRATPRAGALRALRLGVGDAPARAAGTASRHLVRVHDDRTPDAARHQGRRRTRAAGRGRRGGRRGIRGDPEVRFAGRSEPTSAPTWRPSSADSGTRRSTSPSSARVPTARTRTTRWATA